MRTPVTPTVVTITSFGYRHAPAPEADLIHDVRRLLHDPLQMPELRQLTGLHDQVAEHLLNTPGAYALATAAAVTVHRLVTLTGRPVHLAYGCAGGRHRSVALARMTAGALKLRGHLVDVRHRDVHRPVLATAA